MKNFTKTLAAAAIITLASGTESAFAHRLTSDAAELKTNEVLGQVSSKGNINILPWKDIRMEKTTDDIAMFRYIADKSFDVGIHETEASDIAISMPHYIVVPHFIVDKSFDVEIHETEASDKAWHSIQFWRPLQVINIENNIS